MVKVTIKDATYKWVREFNAISQSLIEKAFKDNVDNLTELTVVSAGDKVWSNEFQDQFEVESVDYNSEVVILCGYDEDEELGTTINDVSLENDSWLPMWGTMWTFGDSLDEDWARDNLDVMSNCGFRIYEDEETGDIYFGIDGAGYDFYEAHWIPLYKARGLQWHDTVETA